MLIATGRRPNTRGFGLEEASIELGAKGEIRVNEIADFPAGCLRGRRRRRPDVRVVAAYGGTLAAENALQGDARRYDLSALPRVTFTDPQVAAVGVTEAEARRSGVDVMTTRLPLSHVPRASRHATRAGSSRWSPTERPCGCSARRFSRVRPAR